MPARQAKGGRKRRNAAAVEAAAASQGASKVAIEVGFFEPELAKLCPHPPKGEAWLHEVKWDGYRILATVSHGAVQLWSRNGKPWGSKVPRIRRAVEALGLDSARLDGELIALTDGHPDFNALQKTLAGEGSAPMVYMLFDVTYVEGWDLSASPLVQRKTVLEALLQEPPSCLAYSSHVVGTGDQVFAMACEQKLEGIMSKRASSPYRAGRGDDWRKIKRLEADEFAVVGYTAAKGARKGFGSLLLARPVRGGGWRYVGRVGSGFNDAQLRQLSRSLATGGGGTPTVEHAAGAPRDARWIEPTAVAEVYYRGIGNQDLLRQPSLKAMRPDKTPADLMDSDRSPIAHR